MSPLGGRLAFSESVFSECGFWLSLAIGQGLKRERRSLGIHPTLSLGKLHQHSLLLLPPAAMAPAFLASSNFIMIFICGWAQDFLHSVFLLIPSPPIQATAFDLNGKSLFCFLDWNLCETILLSAMGLQGRGVCSEWWSRRGKRERRLSGIRNPMEE